MLTIYHNPKCSKSNACVAYLHSLNIEISVRMYLETPLSAEELKRTLEKLKLNPTDIIRKNERLYQENFADKKLTEEEWLMVLAENPILIERPIVIKNDKAVIGRPLDNVKKLLHEG